jgi:hypothetical protein
VIMFDPKLQQISHAYNDRRVWTGYASPAVGQLLAGEVQRIGAARRAWRSYGENGVKGVSANGKAGQSTIGHGSKEPAASSLRRGERKMRV